MAEPPFSRYSVIGGDVLEINSAGGRDIKSTRSGSIVFVNLTPQQADDLRQQGYTVKPVKTVSVQDERALYTPPSPVLSAQGQSVDELAQSLDIGAFKNLVSPPLSGAGVRIAIIDTGVRETHELIVSHVVYSKNFTSDPMEDGADHGTAVAAMMVTLCPGIALLNLKALNGDGVGSEEDVVAAIDECMDLWNTYSPHAPHLVNLSIGAADEDDPNDPVRVICREAIYGGLWIYAAAGNGGPDEGTITCPACEEYILSVGAIGHEPIQICDFSSRGPTREGIIKPDTVMYGEDVDLASSTSDTAMRARSGTSFSCAAVAAVSSLFHEAILSYKSQFPDIVRLADPIEMHGVLLPLMCFKPAGAPMGKDNTYGYGVLMGEKAADAMREAVSGIIGVGALAPMVSGMMSVMMMVMMMNMMGGMVV